VKFKLGQLKTEEVKETSALIKKIIRENPYYNNSAKKEFITWYTPNQLSRHLEKKDMIFVVAKLKDKIVGFGSVWKSFGGVGYSDWTMVDKQCRRHGIGIAIWNYKINLAKQFGIHKVMADSLVINEEGIAFAKAHGLRRVAELKKHWYGQDYYLWEKVIGKPSAKTTHFDWKKIEE